MIYLKRPDGSDWRGGRVFSADAVLADPESGPVRIGVWLEGTTFFFRVVGDSAEDVSSDGGSLVFDHGQRVRFTEDGDHYPHIFVKAGTMGTVTSEYEGDPEGPIWVSPDGRGFVDDEWQGDFVWDGPGRGGGDDVTPPFEHVSEHALTLKDLLAGEQPQLTSHQPHHELKLTIDQVTREQMLIWWDQQESR